MKKRLKRWSLILRGKDPEAVIVSFRTGDARLADAMCEEIRTLEPTRRHIEVSEHESFRRDSPQAASLSHRTDHGFIHFRRSLSGRASAGWLSSSLRAGFWPTTNAWSGTICNSRHRLRRGFFCSGVPLDRIYLRPAWLAPFRRDKTIHPKRDRAIEGRAFRQRRKSIAILTPYFPYPLAHGGAVGMSNLLRETAREFDLVLYAFTEAKVEEADLAPVLAFASRVYFSREASLSRAPLVDAPATGGT